MARSPMANLAWLAKELHLLRLSDRIGATGRSELPWLLFLIALTVIIVVAILTLDLISTKLKGLANIRVRKDRVSSLFLEQGLLWTTLPPLLMALYKLIWESAVSACSLRQPFIELAKDQGDGAPAEKSILLDYRSYPTFRSWFIAFRNGHYLIGISILFSLILSIFVVPLSAY
jgi:Protein of unknown function (DUF3433)